MALPLAKARTTAEDARKTSVASRKRLNELTAELLEDVQADPEYKKLANQLADAQTKLDDFNRQASGTKKLTDAATKRLLRDSAEYKTLRSDWYRATEAVKKKKLTILSEFGQWAEANAAARRDEDAFKKLDADLSAKAKSIGNYRASIKKLQRAIAKEQASLKTAKRRKSAADGTLRRTRSRR